MNEIRADLGMADATNSAGQAAQLMRLGMFYAVSQSLYVAAKIGLADALAPGARDVAAVAAATHTHEKSLARLLTVLGGVGLVKLSGDGKYSLTELGALLRSRPGGSLKEVLILLGEEQYAAFGDLLHSVRTGEAAFSPKFGASFYEYLSRDAGRRENFTCAMSALDGINNAGLVRALPPLGGAQVVDVGGGTGSLLLALLQQNPRAQGIVFELPDMLSRIEECVHRSGLSSRCVARAGSFFDAVPAGEVMILRRILHNWKDADCLSILRNCRRSLPDGGRLLVIERVLVPEEPLSFAQLCDLSMLVLQGAQERSRAEYESLLREAGFELAHFGTSDGGLGIMEAVKRA